MSSLRSYIFHFVEVICVASFLQMSFQSCCSERLQDIPHIGEKNVYIRSIQADTMHLDGRKSSLSGQLLLANSRLYYFDNHLVGIKEYDLSGNFISEHIRHGRGPDEMLSPAWISAYDDTKDAFVIQDAGTAQIHYFDTLFRRTFKTPAPFYNMDHDLRKSNHDLRYTLNHPDPESYWIYEYNFDCRRMRCSDGTLFMPVVSDHIRFNKYFLLSNYRKYYRKAHILLSLKFGEKKMQANLLGHYPPIFRHGNLAVYSDYDFYVKDTNIMVSFAADGQIYTYDSSGTIISTFGFSEDGISDKLSSIYSFDEYESTYQQYRNETGYYSRLAECNGIIFRTCKLKNNGQYTLQLYDATTKDMIGRVPIDFDMDIIGFDNGSYYAFIGEDLEHESLNVVSFQL